MISPETVKKASNMDVALLEEGKDNLYFVCGYMVKYNKRFKNFVCNCEADAAWNNPCCHKICLITKSPLIPDEIKESIE